MMRFETLTEEAARRAFADALKRQALALLEPDFPPEPGVGFVAFNVASVATEAVLGCYDQDAQALGGAIAGLGDALGAFVGQHDGATRQALIDIFMRQFGESVQQVRAAQAANPVGRA